MAFARFFFDGTAVVGQAGQAEQAGFFVQHVGDLSDGHVGVFSEEAEDCGIDVAAARTHHEAFQRGQAHAGIA